MSGMMANVDRRTQLAGENRFEMLLFFMNGRRFGINVFKVREVIPTPRITPMPQASAAVRGIAHVRDQTIPMVDLSLATGGKALPAAQTRQAVITEYNRRTQGFLVEGVDRIRNVNWKDVMPPPRRIANRGYVTAITAVGEELVQIIDVEKVLAEMNWQPESDIAAPTGMGPRDGFDHVLVIDDSLVARTQVKGALEAQGWSVSVATDGVEALATLEAWAAESDSPLRRTAAVISDIEMPRMDGYALTRAIRSDERLSTVPVLLHTSLSGVFNRSLVQKVGADGFLAKFDAPSLLLKLQGLVAQARERVASG